MKTPTLFLLLTLGVTGCAMNPPAVPRTAPAPTQSVPTPPSTPLASSAVAETPIATPAPIVTPAPPPANPPPVAVAAASADTPPVPQIRTISPPEEGFYSKELDYDGIPIKANAVVVDQALYEGRARLAEMLGKIPSVQAKLHSAGAELHIIGRDQVPSDLPELARYKGQPYDGNQTIDQRTRGVGGRIVSCGEENLLRLPNDRYRGRDICNHEFAHCIYNYGMPRSVRQQFQALYRDSLAQGRWVGAYAATNDNEFFAELTMWYFGTHGDRGMTGTKPANGPAGLQAYDPDAYALFDAFYSGKMEPK